METSLLIFFVIVVAIPIIAGVTMSAFQRWLQHKERMGQLIADNTAEKAAQYASHVEQLEARLRVLEEIVTDGGMQTAAQIEALRKPPRRVSRDGVTASDASA
jgi:cob(I)alamin adenosyltransferase